MKPELLLPAGSAEAFFAAAEGGADAVYLGLKKFNARGRAKNFTIRQLQALLVETIKRNIKVYITLNTLIKNKEIYDLLDFLYELSQTNISAVIIQDLGLIYLLRKHFPKMKFHASTQMGFHNSLAADFAEKYGFERIILARELTFPELQTISKQSKVQLEIFTHGALCYAFSGRCLFSSWLGGMSANRGMCRQPCRRKYKTSEKTDYTFNLKDIQLLDILPELLKLKIASLKIEGRMKSGEYIYKAAKAYRTAIDDISKLDESRELLLSDFGREKTSYFAGSDISTSITQNPFTGIFIGKVIKTQENSFTVASSTELNSAYRLRVLPESGTDSKSFKIKDFEKTGNTYKIFMNPENIKIGNKVFLIGRSDMNFKSKFSTDGKRINQEMPFKKKKNITAKIGSSKQSNVQQVFVRTDNPMWLNKIFLKNLDHVILNFSKKDWDAFDFHKNFIRSYKYKFILELPKFIPQDSVEFYKHLIKKAYKSGFRNFMLSDIAQIILFEGYSDIKLFTNENVYILNDAAIQFLKEQKIYSYVYPLENDYENLISGKDRMGIIVMYSLPELFYSRMPVDSEDDISSTENEDYRRIVKDGCTIVVPNLPFSLLQYRDKLYDKGFRKFLLDLSYTKPSKHFFNRIFKKLNTSFAEQPSSNFNFKMNLK